VVSTLRQSPQQQSPTLVLSHASVRVGVSVVISGGGCGIISPGRLTTDTCIVTPDGTTGAVAVAIVCPTVHASLLRLPITLLVAVGDRAASVAVQSRHIRRALHGIIIGRVTTTTTAAVVAVCVHEGEEDNRLVVQRQVAVVCREGRVCSRDDLLAATVHQQRGRRRNLEKRARVVQQLPHRVGRRRQRPELRAGPQAHAYAHWNTAHTT
jgi:hypothetical protein